MTRTSVTTLSGGMAGVATGGVVNVVGDAGMVGICVGLAVGVAVNAGEGRVVGGIDVAGGARGPHARVRARINGEPGVVESGARPRGRVVAERAGGRECRRDVVGVGSALVVRAMAGVAVGGRPGVPPVNVATGARHADVRAGEGEAGGVVIEAGRNPGGGVVAHLALLRETGGGMVGVIGALKILQVTGDAQRAEVGEIAAHVAGLALQRGVRPGEGKAGEGMIECGVGPGNGAVANGAVGGKSGGGMVGVGGALKIGHVARRASGGHGGVVAIDVALRAGHFGVRPAQRPARNSVVKIHIHPRTGVVAGGATGGKSRGDVIRVFCGGKVLGMATQAIGGRALEVPAGVAGVAVQGGMHAGERKAGKAPVIELHAKPGVHAVAVLAGAGETGSGVIGIGGLLKLRRVAAQTIGGEPLELPNRRVLVAAIALQQSVRSHQGKAVEMLLDVLHRHPPALHVVTLLAVGAHVAAMNIGVAVGAFCAGVTEYEIGMAFAAGHALMHAAQRKPGLAMVKLGKAANWFPCGKGVAVLAGHGEIAVRAAGAG